MALEHNFRAALNGFNRSDVVNYIEECSINHEKALRQLRDENVRLRADLERLQTEKDRQPEESAEPETAPAPAEVPPAPPAAPTELELAAYRRAEAAERAARQRASQLQQQVQEIISAAAGQFDRSGADMTALMTDLNIALRRLNDILAEIRLSFDETGAAFSRLDTHASSRERS